MYWLVGQAYPRTRQACLLLVLMGWVSMPYISGKHAYMYWPVGQAYPRTRQACLLLVLMGWVSMPYISGKHAYVLFGLVERACSCPCVLISLVGEHDHILFRHTCHMSGCSMGRLGEQTHVSGKTTYFLAIYLDVTLAGRASIPTY